MPNLVEIAGKSNTVSAILDEATGNFATSAIIKSFRFKSPLMEEHFNENYLESSKFPNSTFKGKIVGFDAKKLSASKTAYDIEGDLTLHGVTKKIKTNKNKGREFFTQNYFSKFQLFQLNFCVVMDKSSFEVEFFPEIVGQF